MLPGHIIRLNMLLDAAPEQPLCRAGCRDDLLESNEATTFRSAEIPYGHALRCDSKGKR